MRFVVCKLYVEYKYELLKTEMHFQESISGMCLKYFGNILPN